MKKKESNLLFIFASNIFISILITNIVVVTVIAILYLSGALQNFLNFLRPSPLLPLSLFIVISIIAGSFLSLRVGRKLLIPISNIIDSTKEVATGNFDVEIKSDSKIVAIKEIVDSFNLMIKELSSIETLRNDFLVNVSHEFKTPLASIEGYAQLLQDPSINEEEILDYSKMIIDSSKQLSILVNDILKLSKLENQEVVFDKTTFRLDEQIREAILYLESKWSSKDINMDLDLIKCEYYGSEALLLQVWINLIDNAIKYSKDNSTITIKIIDREYYYDISIQDTGKGISSVDIKHIFDKFYQTEANRNNIGNGLGLSIVKRILDLSNSEISVASYPNTGTIFTIKLNK